MGNRDGAGLGFARPHDGRVTKPDLTNHEPHLRGRKIQIVHTMGNKIQEDG
jgi:hypothetical protein